MYWWCLYQLGNCQASADSSLNLYHLKYIHKCRRSKAFTSLASSLPESEKQLLLFDLSLPNAQMRDNGDLLILQILLGGYMPCVPVPELLHCHSHVWNLQCRPMQNEPAGKSVRNAT